MHREGKRGNAKTKKKQKTPERGVANGNCVVRLQYKRGKIMHVYEGVRRVRVVERPCKPYNVAFEWVGNFDPSEHTMSLGRGMFTMESMLVDGTMTRIGFKLEDIVSIEFDVDLPICHNLL